MAKVMAILINAHMAVNFLLEHLGDLVTEFVKGVLGV